MYEKDNVLAKSKVDCDISRLFLSSESANNPMYLGETLSFNPVIALHGERDAETLLVSTRLAT